MQNDIRVLKHPEAHVVAGKFDYSPRMKVGQRVKVDAYRYGIYGSVMSYRVIGIWKQPKWFSVSWFEKQTRKSAHRTKRG